MNHLDITRSLIISVIHFFLKFNPESPITPQDNGYRSNPSLQDQTYCLVFVIAADKISMAADDNIYKKVKHIKSKADELGEYKGKCWRWSSLSLS